MFEAEDEVEDGGETRIKLRCRFWLRIKFLGELKMRLSVPC